MKAFDFSNFKKIAEDEKSVTMKHPSGHEMTIAIMAIPKLQREQLKMLPLAKGGEVEGISTQGKDVRNAKKAKSRGREGDAVIDMEFAKEEAKGRAAHERMVKPKMKGLADGGDPKNAPNVQDDNSVDQPTDQPPVVVNNITQPQQPVEEPVIQNPAVAQAQIPIKTETPAVPAAIPNLNPNGTLNPSAIAENTQKAAEGQKNIDIEKGKALADVNQGYIQAEAQNEQRRQQLQNDLKRHVDDFAKYATDPKTKLNPDAYRENMSTGSKVAAALGMFLGGLGTPFGGHNYAQDFLDKQIDRDIAAQQKRMDQQQTILGAYQHLYGEGNAAVNATKATMLDIYNNQAKQVALQLNTPQAYQNYLQYSTDNALKQSKLLQDAAVDLNNLPGTNAGKGKHQEQSSPAEKPTEADHILKSTADKDFVSLQYNHPEAKNYEQIRTQKSTAALADKAIDTINELFPKMYENTEGPGGYLRRRGNQLGEIPYIGGIPKAVTDFATDTPNNRAYDSYYSNLVGAVRGALKGLVSEELLDKTVRSNAPESGETEANKELKRKALIKFVKDHTPTDLLGKLKRQ